MATASVLSSEIGSPNLRGSVTFNDLTTSGPIAESSSMGIGFRRGFDNVSSMFSIGELMRGKGLASTRAESEPFSNRSMSQAGLSFRSSTQNFAGSTTASSSNSPSRRNQKRHFYANDELGIMAKLDNVAEAMLKNNVEKPWYLEQCMETPSCQKFCQPADYATRNQKLLIKAMEEKAAEKDHEAAQFGFPAFEQSGFVVTESSEVEWYDDAVPLKLGLRIASHRKTSVSRLCLIHSKADLPDGVGADQMKHLVRGLKRVDHVNVLNCHEVYEDSDSLYFLYENWPAVTLATALQHTTWTEDEAVNLTREILAATTFAASQGLYHLGWSLYHVLLPDTALKGEKMTAKVFGFGHMGVLIDDTSSHLCWAPEAMERYTQIGKAFLTRLENSHKPVCDSWSVGVLTYAIIAKTLPMTTEEQVMDREWAFTMAFEEYDPECKSLVEVLLHDDANKRMKTARAMHHQWIRKKWRPPENGDETYLRLEQFCHSTLTQRLFGRFIARFLDPVHMRRIARSYYALDTLGKGTLLEKDFVNWGKACKRQPEKAHQVYQWLAVEGVTNISLSRFAEFMAEEVIDGTALRHVFESLDDDGSEEISAHELYEILKVYDERLTFEEIEKHISSAEQETRKTQVKITDKVENSADDHGGWDNKLDYNEFVRLFPARLALIHAQEQRLHESRESQRECCGKLDTVRDNVAEWISRLNAEADILKTLSTKTIERVEDSDSAAHSMKRHFACLDACLRKPPGPMTQDELRIAIQHRKYNMKKDGKVFVKYDFDRFIQEQAVLQGWPHLLSHEIKNLKYALHGRADGSMDAIKAFDAAQGVMTKVRLIVSWSKVQLAEYESMVEMMEEPEVMMQKVPFSSRGLRSRGGDGDVDGDDEPEGGDIFQAHQGRKGWGDCGFPMPNIKWLQHS